MKKLATCNLPNPLLITRHIVAYIFNQFVDIYYSSYRALIGDHWINVCSILIYEMVSFFVGRARIKNYWSEKRDIKDMIIKYLPVFPIEKSKIEYKGNSKTKKTYTMFYCEDLALKGSLTLTLRNIRVVKEIIDQTVPMLYYGLFVVMLAPLFSLIMNYMFFGESYYVSEMINFVLRGYVYLLPLSIILTSIALYTRISEVMEKRSAFKYAIQVTLASIIIFPLFIMLFVVRLIYSAISTANKIVRFIRLGRQLIKRIKKWRKSRSKKSLGSLPINSNSDLFDGIALIEIIEGTIHNSEALDIYSKRLYNILYYHNEQELKKLLHNLKLDKSPDFIKREVIIDALQTLWKHGMVPLILELYYIAVSGLKNQLSDLTDPHKAKQNSMSAFALAVLMNRSRYIFLFIITLPVLILTRNLLRLFFPWTNTYLIYLSDLDPEKELYEKYKEAYERYCRIEKGCIKFSHVYLPDFGFKGGLYA